MSEPFDYAAYEDVPEWFRDLPMGIRTMLANAGMAPKEWLLQPKTRGIPEEWREFERVRGYGFVAPSLGPIYGLGFLERGQRAGYLQVFPEQVGGGWSFADREQYYQNKQAILSVSPSVFWAGYYQGRYGEEPPSWIQKTQQQYRVSEEYWKAQQAWSPVAMGWSAARIGLYAAPGLGAVRAFGFPFYGAAERIFIASHLKPYVQGMPYETKETVGGVTYTGGFAATSAAWIERPQDFRSELVSGGLLWTGVQSASWMIRGGLEAVTEQGFSRAAFLAGAGQSLRQTIGWNVAQMGLGLLVGPLTDVAVSYILGHPEQAQKAFMQGIPQMATGTGLMGLGYVLNRWLKPAIGGGIEGWGLGEISTMVGADFRFGTPLKAMEYMYGKGFDYRDLFVSEYSGYPRGPSYEFAGFEKQFLSGKYVKTYERGETGWPSELRQGGGGYPWGRVFGQITGMLTGMAGYFGYERFLAPTIRERYGETASELVSTGVTLGTTFLGTYGGEKYLWPSLGKPLIEKIFGITLGGGAAPTLTGTLTGMLTSMVTSPISLALIALTATQLSYSLGLVAETGTPRFQPYVDVSMGELSPSSAGGPLAGGYAPAIIMDGGVSQINKQIEQYNAALKGIDVTFGTQMEAIGGRSRVAYGALNQAWDTYYELQSAYNAAWLAYDADKIDYKIIASMKKLRDEAYNQVAGVKKALPDFGVQYQNVYSTTAATLRKQVETVEAAVGDLDTLRKQVKDIEAAGGDATALRKQVTDLEKAWKTVWDLEFSARPSQFAGITPVSSKAMETWRIQMEEGAVYPNWGFQGITKVSRLPPARRTMLQMEEGPVDITRGLGPDALSMIYGEVLSGGWRGVGAGIRQREVADILTHGQAGEMLSRAFIEAQYGEARGWETSAFIRQAGAGLTGVWWAAAGEPLSAAALRFHLTGLLDVPPGYSREDVERVIRSWRDEGSLPSIPLPGTAMGGGVQQYRPSPYEEGAVIPAQAGLDRVFTSRTNIQVAEAGPERVIVKPLSGGGDVGDRELMRLIEDVRGLLGGGNAVDYSNVKDAISPLLAKDMRRGRTARGG